jgi:hypothetical protein
MTGVVTSQEVLQSYITHKKKRSDEHTVRR